MNNSNIQNLIEKIKSSDLDAYYLNSSDDHLSEYVAAYFRTIAYFSGFTGSVSSLIIDKEKAYIFVDGRYHIQADNECSPLGIEVIKLGNKDALEPEDFLEKHYKGKRIGLDAKRTSIDFVKKLISKGLIIKDIDLYSDLIIDRPKLANDKLKELDIKYTGKSRKRKLNELKYCLDGKSHIINNLESIAYLLNLRGNDIIYTPVFYAFLVVYQNDIYFFINLERLDEDIIDRLYEDEVIIRPYDSYYDFLKVIRNEIVLLDELKVNFKTYLSLKNHGNRIINMPSIVEDMKSLKNEVEISNSIMANIYDGVAMTRFLLWMSKTDKKELNEYDVAQKLNSFRLEYKAFDLSFNPIVAYNANAAMMHYGPTKEKNTKLDNKGILLIDSGGQYLEGTTDITRTISLGEVTDIIKKHFTIVLKSMLNLSEVKFLSGFSGKQLDILARKDIFELGINYRCGTGHGVGQVLSVHEAPPNIRFMKTVSGSEDTPLRAGQIVTDEPGIYLDNEYGIRCENMLLVRKDENNEYGQFLKFKTLTMCPFDLKLIDKKYLDDKTLKALNNYHREVYDNLSPYLNDEEKDFLKEITREI